MTLATLPVAASMVPGAVSVAPCDAERTVSTEMPAFLTAAGSSVTFESPAAWPPSVGAAAFFWSGSCLVSRSCLAAACVAPGTGAAWRDIKEAVPATPARNAAATINRMFNGGFSFVVSSSARRMTTWSQARRRRSASAGHQGGGDSRSRGGCCHMSGRMSVTAASASN